MKRQLLMWMTTAALAAGLMATANAQMPAPLRNGSVPAARRHVPRNHFDEYLDHHPEVREDLRRHPGLANNSNYLAHHPGLNNYLGHHPGVRNQFQKHPKAFMNREKRYQRRERRRG